MKHCPCGSQKRYLDCCGPYILKKQSAPTPEALMRSRYTAFVEGNINYIQKTMVGEALLNFDKRAAKKKVSWLGLEVIETTEDSDNSQIGYVEFKARYEMKATHYCIHEKSIFHLINNKWFYASAITSQVHLD